MKDDLWKTPNGKVQYIRDAHSNTFHIHETAEVDHILERNKRIRLESLMTHGTRNPLMDDDEIGYAFSIPVEAFAWFKKRHPDILEQINSKDVDERMRGAQRLLILHPEWSLMEANR